MIISVLYFILVWIKCTYGFIRVASSEWIQFLGRVMPDMVWYSQRAKSTKLQNSGTMGVFFIFLKKSLTIYVLSETPGTLWSHCLRDILVSSRLGRWLSTGLNNYRIPTPPTMYNLCWKLYIYYYIKYMIW